MTVDADNENVLEVDRESESDFVAVLLVYLAKRPAVPNDYTFKVKTGGDIEAKYLAMGPYEVSYLERSALQDFKKYEIYYPNLV